MKKKNLLQVFSLVMLLIIPLIGKAQEIDQDDNYYLSYQKYLDYLIQLAESEGKNILELKEYKHFTIWADHFRTKINENASMKEFGVALEDYYSNFQDVEGEIELEWEYNSPDGLWCDWYGALQPGSGQNLIISLWINPSNPDHILAGGQFSSGLWETLDEGNSWSNISENESQIQGVSSIYVNPDDTNNIFITTTYSAEDPGGYANGLFYTYDGGNTWLLDSCYTFTGIAPQGDSIFANYFPLANAGRSPRVFLQNPEDTSIMWLLLPYQLIMSHNGGQKWYRVIESPDESQFYNIHFGKQFFNDMAFDPADPSTVYVTGPEAYRIDDNGAFVTNITDSLLKLTGSSVAYTISVDCHVNYPDSVWFSFIDTLNGKTHVALYNKEDSTYTVKNTLIGINTHWLECEVSPKNPNHILLGGGNYMYCYDFNDGSYEDYFRKPGYHNDTRCAEWPYINDTTDYALMGTDGGLTKVYNFNPDNNANFTWKYLANDSTDGIRNIDVQGFDVSRYGEDIMTIGTSHDGMILKKDNKFIKIFRGGDQETTLIDPENPNNIYAVQYGHDGLDFSKNMGQSSDTFYIKYNHNDPVPILFFKPGDTKTLYAGAYRRILEFNTDSLSLYIDPKEHYFADTIIDTLNGISYVREAGLNNDLQNMFFFATNRYWNWWYGTLDSNHHYAFMKGEIINDSIVFTDLSENLSNGLYAGPITGIAIEVNENDTLIYTAFGGTNKSLDSLLYKKVYFSKNLGESWFPMADGLPEKIPVNDIQYHRESGLLFLANDVGVYYFSREDSIWMNVTYNLPPMTYSKIRFSLLRSKILVGSHSKGVWEADLPCFYDTNADTIFSTITWNCSVPMHNDLIIENDATLTIKKEVFMPPSAKIIIKRGGTLIVDGGKITSACGELWKGIEVWGDPTRQSNDTYQGKVIVMNGGTIENAEIGIRTVKVVESGGGKLNDLAYAGGIVQAVNANFLNNKEAVRFFKYPATGYNYQYSGFINTSRFETNEDYIGSTNPGYFVILSEINVISIVGCEFVNNSGIQSLQSGIYSYNSQFRVDGYMLGGSQQYTLFDSLQYGIYAISSSPNRYADIRHTNFDRNFRGLYIIGMTLARITSNIFNTDAPFSPIGGYGMYLNGSTAYWVEDNDFIHEGDSAVGVGLIVSNSGSLPNEVYGNRFNNLAMGISAQELNCSLMEPAVGLQIRCNDFDICSADIMVPRPRNLSWGIAPNQGSFNEEDPDPSDMAGNLFYIPEGPINNNYDDINNQGRHVTYYYPDNTIYYNVRPVDYTHEPPYNTVTLEGNDTDPLWTPENGCPSGIEGGGGGEGRSSGELLGDIGIAKQKIDSTESFLAMLVDGGNTEALQTDVEYSLPPEAMAIYTELIDNSPYLSDTVVSTVIEKENVLPGAMVRDVMVANPHTAKNNELMNKLDERWTPLPEYMKEQILQGKDIVSVKEKTESKLAKFRLDKARAMNTLARNWTNDTAAGMDSLTMLYEQDNGVESKYKLAFRSMEQGAWSMGMATLSNIPELFELSEAEQEEYNNVWEYFGLISSLNGGLPDSSGIQELTGIMVSEQGAAAWYALNTLINLDEIEYEEPIEMPEYMKSAEAHSSVTSINNTTEPQFLKVMPNPASDFIIVEYELEAQGTSVIEITDLTGKPFHSVQTTNLKDQLTIDARNWKPGTYIALLKINGRTKETVKFTITN